MNARNSKALKIAKEAVTQLNIPKGFPAEIEFQPNTRWFFYYQEESGDIVLSIQLNPLITRTILHTSVGLVALNFLREVESILSTEKAKKLLAVEESEREQTIYDKTLSLTREYIQYLPMVIFHSFHQAFRETIISHIKNLLNTICEENGRQWVCRKIILLSQIIA